MADPELLERVTRMEVRVDGLERLMAAHIGDTRKEMGEVNARLEAVQRLLSEAKAERARHLGFFAGIVATVSAIWGLALALWSFVRNGGGGGA